MHFLPHSARDGAVGTVGAHIASDGAPIAIVGVRARMRRVATVQQYSCIALPAETSSMLRVSVRGHGAGRTLGATRLKRHLALRTFIALDAAEGGEKAWTAFVARLTVLHGLCATGITQRTIGFARIWRKGAWLASGAHLLSSGRLLHARFAKGAVCLTLVGLGATSITQRTLRLTRLIVKLADRAFLANTLAESVVIFSWVTWRLKGSPANSDKVTFGGRNACIIAHLVLIESESAQFAYARSRIGCIASYITVGALFSAQLIILAIRSSCAVVAHFHPLYRGKEACPARLTFHPPGRVLIKASIAFDAVIRFSFNALRIRTFSAGLAFGLVGIISSSPSRAHGAHSLTGK
jgi:hypothetical protein